MGIKERISKSFAWIKTKGRWISETDIRRNAAAGGFTIVTGQMLFQNQQQLKDEEMAAIDEDPFGVAERLHAVVISFLGTVDDQEMRTVVRDFEYAMAIFESQIINTYFYGSYQAFQEAIKQLQGQKLSDIRSSRQSTIGQEEQYTTTLPDGRKATLMINNPRRFMTSEQDRGFIDVRKKLTDYEVKAVLEFTSWFKMLTRQMMTLVKDKMINPTPVVLYSGMPMTQRTGKGEMSEQEQKAREAGDYG